MRSRPRGLAARRGVLHAWATWICAPQIWYTIGLLREKTKNDEGARAAFANAHLHKPSVELDPAIHDLAVLEPSLRMSSTAR